MRILFWNTARHDLTKEVAAIVERDSVDLVILAESRSEPVALTTALGDEFVHYESTASHTRDLTPPQVFGRVSETVLDLLTSESRYETWRLATADPDLPTILLVTAHFPSKLQRDDWEQKSYGKVVRENLMDLEKRYQTNGLLVIGDLNMNPYDPGMIDADAFHGVGDSVAVIETGHRTVDGVSRELLYNPSWRLLFEGAARPHGTYYSEHGSYRRTYWSVLDQAVVSRSLIDPLSDDSPRLVKHAASPLLILTPEQNTKSKRRKVGAPDPAISDHLPILVDLSIDVKMNHRMIA